MTTLSRGEDALRRFSLPTAKDSNEQTLTRGLAPASPSAYPSALASWSAVVLYRFCYDSPRLPEAPVPRPPSPIASASGPAQSKTLPHPNAPFPGLTNSRLTHHES